MTKLVWIVGENKRRMKMLNEKDQVMHIVFMKANFNWFCLEKQSICGDVESATEQLWAIENGLAEKPERLKAPSR